MEHERAGLMFLVRAAGVLAVTEVVGAVSFQGRVMLVLATLSSYIWHLLYMELGGWDSSRDSVKPSELVQITMSLALGSLL